MRTVRLAVALLVLAGCAGAGKGGGRETLRFWGMGREGEVVEELARDFERENPGIDLVVQQIPWSAAHEKLLTAHVGRSTPDLAQLGNTWIAEFSALKAIEPLDAYVDRSAATPRSAWFRGILETNVIDGVLYGLPWYVDTRVLFYRRDLLARAGYDRMPATWEEWREAMAALTRNGAEYAILLPVNEWVPSVIMGLQAGSPLLAANDTRGAFSGPEFRRAFDFYLGLFREGLAPPVRNNEVANLYQEFERGYFAMYITGPWNIGEFRRRLPAEMQDAWATAPLPGPGSADRGVSVAGGSSLVLFRGSEHKASAWRLVEYLSRPDVQARFFALTGDLPARIEAWEDSAIVADPALHAFREQLDRTVATPKVPEWEEIATRVLERTELAVRGGVAPDSVLAALDRDVDRILEKRRWLIEHHRAGRTGGRDGGGDDAS